MKKLSVQEASGQLARLIAEANSGELVILQNGSDEVTLYPGGSLNLEEDTPELERELLKAADGPFAPYSNAEFREMGKAIVRKLKE